jgi:hypothetical protein
MRSSLMSWAVTRRLTPSPSVRVAHPACEGGLAFRGQDCGLLSRWRRDARSGSAHRVKQVNSETGEIFKKVDQRRWCSL